MEVRAHGIFPSVPLTSACDSVVIGRRLRQPLANRSRAGINLFSGKLLLVPPSKLANAVSFQVVPFEEVYDATHEFTSKSAMPQLRAADIAEDDIIIVECNFTRWKKPGENKKKLWASWDVGFELISISVLYAEPTTASGVPEVPPAHANAMFHI